MSSTLNHWRKVLANPRVKRVTIFVGKCAVGAGTAGAGLALGLRQVKHGLDMRERKDPWKQATCHLHALSESVQSKLQAKHRSLLERIRAVGDFTVTEFQNAARHLRPVELELQQLAEVPDEDSAKLPALAARWRQKGYLSRNAGAPPAFFGRRLTSDAQGVDIGVMVPPYLFPESDVPAVHVPEWSADLREAGVSSLEQWGCVLLRGALARDDVSALRDAFGMGSGSNAQLATQVGQVLLSHDSNIAMGRYTFGRLHCLLRGSPTFEPLAVAVHSALAPLVHAYFARSESSEGRVFLSEAQLIIADPMAEQQGWYVNSVGGPGLTVFVPLARINSNSGTHQVLPGTHHLQQGTLSMRERLSRCLSALCTTHGAMSVVDDSSSMPWDAGDALVLDGRVMHRARGNDSMGAAIPVLVLRYDLADSPPPGCSRWWLLYLSQVAASMDMVFRLYAAV